MLFCTVVILLLLFFLFSFAFSLFFLPSLFFDLIEDGRLDDVESVMLVSLLFVKITLRGIKKKWGGEGREAIVSFI